MCKHCNENELVGAACNYKYSKVLKKDRQVLNLVAHPKLEGSVRAGAKKGAKISHVSGAPLDTVVLHGTNGSSEVLQEKRDILEGVRLEGTTSDDRAILAKRAKRVYMKNYLALGMVDINKARRLERLETATTIHEKLEAENEEKDILRSYWNMYHCSSELVEENGKVRGNYCKGRLCMVCNAIRTAVLIEKYKPVFDEWGDDCYFVTLTAPTVPEEELVKRIDDMKKVFVKVKATLKKRHQRSLKAGKECMKFEGLRKLECTYRPKTKHYHPHYHLIVRGKSNADELLKLWLKATKSWGTSELAQDVRKADQGVRNELFKYFTKVVTSSSDEGGAVEELGMDKLLKGKIYLHALDTIFRAFRGKRVFQSFGFKVPKVSEQEFDEAAELQAKEEEEKEQELEQLVDLIQRVELEQGEYILASKFWEWLEDKRVTKGIKELKEWLEDEDRRGLPFIDRAQLLELLGELIGELNEREEIKRTYIWVQELGDWFDLDTGEALSGNQLSSRDRKFSKSLFIPTKYRRHLIELFLSGE